VFKVKNSKAIMDILVSGKGHFYDHLKFAEGELYREFRQKCFSSKQSLRNLVKNRYQ
jgi:hypothetical protein